MTAVNIKGTFTKNERTDNGLESIAKELVGDEWKSYVVVGVVELHKVVKTPGEPPVPTVRFKAVEPLLDGDEAAGRGLLDAARKNRGLAALGETLFDADRDTFTYDSPDDDGEDGEVPGQLRFTGDGPREVPEPSGEEIVADLDERRASKAAER